MSDTAAVHPDPADFGRPEPPRSWRGALSSLAETLDLSPPRLAVGLVAVLIGGLLAWRVLAPVDPPAEMKLPFAQAQATSAGPSGSPAPGGSADPSGGAAAGGPPADGSPSSGGGAGEPGAGGATEPDAPGGSPGGGPGDGDAGGPAGTAGGEVVVHVAGAVTAPGVQRLPAGARVVDAVDRAGGATSAAELARVNLAAALEDGQQVYVPAVGEQLPATAAGTAPSPSGGGTAGDAATTPSQPVDINTATGEQLDTLPGVGPATASAIISHRERNGPFSSVDQLLDVRGIGQAKLDGLRDLVTV